MEQNGSDAYYNLKFSDNAEETFKSILKIVDDSTKKIEASFTKFTESIDQKTLETLKTIQTRIQDTVDNLDIKIDIPPVDIKLQAPPEAVNDLIKGVQDAVGKDWKLTVPVDITPTVVLKSFLENQKEEAAQDLMKDLPHLEIPMYPKIDWTGITEQITSQILPLIVDTSDIKQQISVITVPVDADLSLIKEQISTLSIPIDTDTTSLQQKLSNIVVPITAEITNINNKVDSLIIPASVDLTEIQNTVKDITVPVKADLSAFTASVTKIKPVKIPVSLEFKEGDNVDATVGKANDLSVAFGSITGKVQEMAKQVTGSIGDISAALDTLYSKYGGLLDKIIDPDKTIAEQSKQTIADLQASVIKLTEDLDIANKKLKDGFKDSEEESDKVRKGIDESALAAVEAAEYFEKMSDRIVSYFKEGMAQIAENAREALRLTAMVGEQTDKVIEEGLRATKGLLDDGDIAKFNSQLSAMFVSSKQMPEVMKTVADYAHQMKISMSQAFSEVTNFMTNGLSAEDFRKQFGERGREAQLAFNEEMKKAQQEMNLSGTWNTLSREDRSAVRAKAMDAVLRQFGQASEGPDTLAESFTRLNTNIDTLQQKLSGPFTNALGMILKPVNAVLEMIDALPEPILAVIGMVATLASGLIVGTIAIIGYYKATEILGLNLKNVLAMLMQFKNAVLVTIPAQIQATIATIARTTATLAGMAADEAATIASGGLMASLNLIKTNAVAAAIALGQKTVAVVSGIAADVAATISTIGLSGAFFTLTGALGTATAAMVAFIVSAAPILVPIAAITAAIYLLWDVFNKGWDKSLLGGFFVWLSQYIPQVTPVIEGFGRVFQWLSETGGKAIKYLGEVWDSFVKGAMLVLQPAYEMFQELMKIVLEFLGIKIDNASISDMFTAFISECDKFIKFLKDSGILDALKEIAKWVGIVAAVLTIVAVAPFIASILAVIAVLKVIIDAIKFLVDLFNSFMKACGSTGNALTALAALCNPVTAPFVLLGAAIAYVKDHLTSIPDLIAPVKNAFSGLGDTVKLLAMVSNPFGLMLLGINMVSKGVDAVTASLKNVSISSIVNSIKNDLKPALDLINAGLGAVSKTVDTASSGFTSLMKIISSISVAGVVSAISSIPGQIMGSFSSILNISDIIKNTVSYINDLKTTTGDVFTSLFGGIANTIINSVKYINEVFGFIISIMDKILNPFKTLRDIIMYLSEKFKIFRDIADSVKDVFDKIKNALQGVTDTVNAIIDKIKQLIDQFNSIKPPDWAMKILQGNIGGAAADVATDAVKSFTKKESITNVVTNTHQVIDNTKRETSITPADNAEALAKMNNHLQNISDKTGSGGNTFDMSGMSMSFSLPSQDLAEAINKGTVDVEKLGQAIARITKDQIIGYINHEMETWGI